MLGATSDPTRRQILDPLGEGPATISELAARFGMSLDASMGQGRIRRA